MKKRLTKDDIRSLYLKVLDCTDLKPEQLWLSSGSAMVMHGLRVDTADIDSGCHQEAFNLARSMLKCQYVPFRKGPCIHSRRNAKSNSRNSAYGYFAGT